MAVYAHLDKVELEGLVRRFGVDDIVAFSTLHGGSENTSYCVETNAGKYVLTLWDQKSLERASKLASLLVYLADHGIRTSKVVVPPEGPMVLLHGDKPVMLKHYIDGDVTADLKGNLLGRLGEEMARLHGIAAPSYLPDAFPYGRRYFPEVINSGLSHAYIDWLAEKNRYFQECIPQDLPKALIHGDVFFDNLVVRGDELIAIIDFEEACHYHRGFDLGMALVGSCRDGQSICFDKARRFMQGYLKETTLQPGERESLQVFAVYAAVATSFWRFRHYHLRRPEQRRSNAHVEMRTLADTIAAYPNSRFAELSG